VRRTFAAFLLLLAARAGFAVILDRIAATIDDDVITEQELDQAVDVGTMTRRDGESEEDFRLRVLNELIDERLRYRDAARFAPDKPDAADLDAAYRDLLARLRKEGKDPQKEFARVGASEDEVKAVLERQLIVSRYVRERFFPVTYATTEEARKYYDGDFSAALKAEGKPVPPFEEVVASLRQHLRQEAFDQAVTKWTADLREKARITIDRQVPRFEARTPRVLATVPNQKEKK
jgi:hypothetical protein